jgi:hypothetical protein
VPSLRENLLPASAKEHYWPSSRLQGRLGHALVVLFFIGLTALAARNALTRLDSLFLGADPDVFINPWADWWTARAISDPTQRLWETNYLFYPDGASLHFHSFSHLNTLLSLAIGRFAGPLAGINITILANYVLAGVSMFYLAR